MRGPAIRGILLAGFMAIPWGSLGAQEVVDRIVARVENDVILWSDVRALARYQQFLDGKSESDDQILDRLIDQCLGRVRNSFATDEEYQARMKQAGLSEQDLQAMVASQLYLSNYLDSRFRAAVRIDPKEIADFYQSSVVPRAKARGQEPPTLDAARDSIQEALIQNGINRQAEQWLKESRLRVHIEKSLDEVAR